MKLRWYNFIVKVLVEGTAKGLFPRFFVSFDLKSKVYFMGNLVDMAT